MEKFLKKQWEKAEIEAIEINLAEVATSFSTPDGTFDLPDIPTP